MKKICDKKIWRFILIVGVSTLISILLHQVHQDPLLTLSSKEKSLIVTSGWFPPIASVSLACAFSIIGLMFLGIQKTLRSTRIRKGSIFGLALGGMYIIGMVEAHVIFSLSFFGEFYTGIADCSGILLMSILLGKYFADDLPDNGSSSDRSLSGILIIAAVYTAVRYLSYRFLNIESSCIERPFATFLWTGGMGCWIGIMYQLIGGDKKPSYALRHAALFGGLIFGFNWLIFNLFALLFIVVPLWDILCRSVFDGCAVILGVWLSSKLRGYYRKTHKHIPNITHC